MLTQSITEMEKSSVLAIWISYPVATQSCSQHRLTSAALPDTGSQPMSVLSSVTRAGPFLARQSV